MRKCRQWVGGDGFDAILRVDAMTAARGRVGGGLVTIISSAPAGTRQADADGSRADARRLFELYPGLLDLHERQRALVNMQGEVRTKSNARRRPPCGCHGGDSGHSESLP
jgi:hypothetical protein